ncbi:MAG: radical SAM protein [Kiritimatiellae bacterium]|nr:radical SAM protein [Kiritimatiellia bacterium]
MSRGAERLYGAVVEITNRCNFRCPHCASASGEARADEMGAGEMAKLAGDLAALGCREFTMLGGEFLLRPDWGEIGAAVKAAGMELQLITNGLLVTPEVRRRFKALDPQTVCVSFDGATRRSYRAVRGVDGFDRCRRLIAGLVDDGFRQVSAITTFSSRNLGDFDRFVEMFIDTPVVWQVQIVHRAGERFDDSLLLNDAQFAEFADRATKCLCELHGRLRLQVMDDFGYFPVNPKLAFLCQRWDGCPAGRRVVGIRANGDVLPCLSLGGGFVEDNLRRRPIAAIWRDPGSFARFRHKSDRLTGFCAKCPAAKRCKAGCTAAAISNSGSATENRFCLRRLETTRLADLR